MAPRRPAAPAKPAPAPKTAAAPKPTQSSDFGERLRAQREAAELLAKRRSQETRARLAGSADSSSGPRFTFADEELDAAKPQPTPKAEAAALPPSSASSAGQRAASQPPAAAPRNPYAAQPRQNGGAPRPYQPSDAYRQTHGYREYDEAPQPAPRPPARPAYEEPAERGAYVPPAQGSYRAPQSRQGGYRDELSDELFDDRNARAGVGRPQRRAAADEYTAAYRDYDEAFDYEEEPRRKGGLWIFILLMLMVVAAIGLAAFWYINYGSKIGSKASGGGVPTISAPESPVKVAPTPVEPAAPNAPVKRKKIYDRILGDQTLEPEKLVPTEERPVSPPPVAAPPPANNNPIGVEPLPLPLPPPPAVPGVQGSVSQKTGKLALTAQPRAAGGKTSITPTSGGTQTSTVNTGGSPAPLTLPPVTSGQPETINEQTASPSVPATPEQAIRKVLPVPRKKPNSIIVRAKREAEQRRLAALSKSVSPPPQNPTARPQALPGSGPVQIAPQRPANNGQNFATRRVPAPVERATQTRPHTNIASLPQPAPQPATPQQAPVGAGYVLQMSSFKSRDGAAAEYRRLASRHAGILSGLSPQIQESDLGANGKFYKLRLGSIASRNQAARLCNSLISAGEKDCLVRKR
jgi:hypothetical protein